MFQTALIAAVAVVGTQAISIRQESYANSENVSGDQIENNTGNGSSINIYELVQSLDTAEFDVKIEEVARKLVKECYVSELDE